MTTYFLKSGSRYNISNKASMDLHESLPVGTYTIKFDQMSGKFFLETIDDFELSGKIYGDTLKNAGRILDTFESRPDSTGVMLSGEKGSGKTLLAKKLSLEGMERGFPTIVINQPWAGETFNVFMQMIEQPVVVIFDEFEKVYPADEQEQLLTLLDGVYPSKKLYILTCNDRYRVNEHMRNRPGRIFYRIDYKGLSVDFIREYCEDNLDDKAHIDSLCRLSILFTAFNFDILKAMVEEMNRYKETPQEAMQMLNAKPELSDSATYELTLFINSKELSADETSDKRWRGNPLTGTVAAYHINAEKKDEDGDPAWEQYAFSATDLKRVDAETGHFVFERGNARLIMKKEAPATYNYNDAF
jgi:hypothetical protein